MTRRRALLKAAEEEDAQADVGSSEFMWNWRMKRTIVASAKKATEKRITFFLPTVLPRWFTMGKLTMEPSSAAPAIKVMKPSPFLKMATA